MRTPTVRESGFTLIEVLAVMVLLGILAAIAVPQFVRHRRAAHETVAISDMKNAVQTATTYGVAHHEDYTGLDGATERSPLTLAEGYPVDDWVTLRFHGRPGWFCVEGRHVEMPDTSLVYRSDAAGVSAFRTCA